MKLSLFFPLIAFFSCVKSAGTNPGEDVGGDCTQNSNCKFPLVCLKRNSQTNHHVCKVPAKVTVVGWNSGCNGRDIRCKPRWKCIPHTSFSSSGSCL